MLKKGDKFVDFELVNTDLKKIKLSEHLNGKVALVFYPGAFTSVCEKELCSFRDMIAKFNNINAKVFGISVDSPFSNKAFAEKNHLSFDLLSDFGGKVSEKYGGIHKNFIGIENYTVSKRAVYIIDENGTIIYDWVSDDPGKEPLYDEIEKILEQ
ncbi:alkyl hydroperoxide reductase [Thermosipho melanesiensis]|uniref:Alkyl hydroperoxide reductase/ Thiol specific antioxidant/ Mal allergen n=2 Tax=Thermosipho melanesiensis TaxID=46541 RepID=A6LL21_THEM4|nr:peroxiredoxin [Thermosipho melanesiensis]ABR30622.1 alkyl hydroperoxide reductase/ Thiol specific antioxidant/ Mal allergen [Thermosipho melanesiensis BI429]APT73762.1 alkyl hydroperoxide reductase [Thermosipho melanesiensis]OOC35702.1 alkyl hydroperoxide reductase [Thermosipho melanesiensis]OOC39001.1 alkyl hydroperoxide reductase [Thermosipho melanesiensis]OOC39149.1 alkyl hydroperoxide reductase [Thermosipho melanesiensis]